MNIWVDAQLPPTLASWLNDTFEVNAVALRDFGLRDAKDIEIFERRECKCYHHDERCDFVDLVCRLGSPPQILWLTCGNVTNRNLRQPLSDYFS